MAAAAATWRMDAAALMRMNLLTPAGAIMSHETYNRTFTLHGVVMV